MACILSIFLIVCLSVTVKWLAVKTAPEMTYTVSGGALNSTQSNPMACIIMWGFGIKLFYQLMQ